RKRLGVFIVGRDAHEHLVGEGQIAEARASCRAGVSLPCETARTKCCGSAATSHAALVEISRRAVYRRLAPTIPPAQAFLRLSTLWSMSCRGRFLRSRVQSGSRRFDDFDVPAHSATQRSRSLKLLCICSSANPSAKKRSAASPGRLRVRPSPRS